MHRTRIVAAIDPLELIFCIATRATSPDRCCAFVIGAPGNFGRDLLEYLVQYTLPCRNFDSRDATDTSMVIKTMINIVRQVAAHNMSGAKDVALVGSVPGLHKGPVRANLWGHIGLRAKLRERAAGCYSDDVLIFQCCAIESLGIGGGRMSRRRKLDDWLGPNLLTSAAAVTTAPGGQHGTVPHPQLRLVWPSVMNVAESFDGYGTRIAYKATDEACQPFLRTYAYQWLANWSGRSRALPRLNTYTRVSADLKEIRWTLLSSASLSTAAWGVEDIVDLNSICRDDPMNTSEPDLVPTLLLKNYELGVLLFSNPDRKMVPAQFRIDPTQSAGKDVRVPLPYQLPLIQLVPMSPTVSLSPTFAYHVLL